jgi:hypothetical protein
MKAMPPKGNLRRYRVGVLFNGNPDLVAGILALGHRSIVFSDRFRALYRVHRAYRKVAADTLFDTAMMIEVSLDALPIAPSSLDVLIVSNGLTFKRSTPEALLEKLESLIKPGGSFIWPERINDGFFGGVSKVAHTFSTRALGPIARRHLCRLSMAAGFREIGQIVTTNHLFPWVVTVGKVGNRPWLQRFSRFGTS